MSVYKHKIERQGFTGEVLGFFQSEGKVGPSSVGGAGKARGWQYGKYDADGWLKAANGLDPYEGPASENGVHERPDRMILELRQDGEVVATITFYPVETAPGEVDINKASQQGKPPAASPEQLASLNALLTTGQAQQAQTQQALAGIEQTQLEALALIGIDPQYISATTANPPAATANGTAGARRTATGGIQRLLWQGGQWVVDGGAVAGAAEVQAADDKATAAQADATEAQSQATGVRMQVQANLTAIQSGTFDPGEAQRVFDDYGYPYAVLPGVGAPAANGATVHQAANGKRLILGQQPRGVDFRLFARHTDNGDWGAALTRLYDSGVQHVELPNFPMLCLTRPPVFNRPMHFFGSQAGGQFGGNAGLISGATGTAFIHGAAGSEPLLHIAGTAGNRLIGSVLRDLQIVNRDSSWATARKLLKMEYIANQTDFTGLVLDGAGTETAIEFNEVWDGVAEKITVRHSGLAALPAVKLAGDADSTNAMRFWFHIEFCNYLLEIGHARHIALSGKYESGVSTDNTRIRVRAEAMEVTFLPDCQFVNPGGPQGSPFFWVENDETRIYGWMNTANREGTNWLNHTGKGLELDATVGWARGAAPSFAFGDNADVRLRARIAVGAGGVAKFMQLNGSSNRIRTRVKLVNGVDNNQTDASALPALTAGPLYDILGQNNHIDHAGDRGYALWAGGSNNEMRWDGELSPYFFAGMAPNALDVRGAARIMQINGGSVSSLTGGFAGQQITLVATGGAGNTTFVHGAGIKLKGAANAVLSADQSITLVCWGDHWREIARNF